MWQQSIFTTDCLQNKLRTKRWNWKQSKKCGVLHFRLRSKNIFPSLWTPNRKGVPGKAVTWLGRSLIASRFSKWEWNVSTERNVLSSNSDTIKPTVTSSGTPIWDDNFSKEPCTLRVNYYIERIQIEYLLTLSYQAPFPKETLINTTQLLLCQK